MQLFEEFYQFSNFDLYIDADESYNDSRFEYICDVHINDTGYILIVFATSANYEIVYLIIDFEYKSCYRMVRNDVPFRRSIIYSLNLKSLLICKDTTRIDKFDYSLNKKTLKISQYSNEIIESCWEFEELKGDMYLLATFQSTDGQLVLLKLIQSESSEIKSSWMNIGVFSMAGNGSIRNSFVYRNNLYPIISNFPFCDCLAKNCDNCPEEHTEYSLEDYKLYVHKLDIDLMTLNSTGIELPNTIENFSPVSVFPKYFMD